MENMSMKSMNDNDPFKRSSLSLKNAKKQGWMLKEGGAGVSKNWKRRFFILEGEYLYYFPEGVSKKPKGLIHLPEYTSIESVSEKESTKKNCFKLFDPNNKDLRVLYCSTSKPSEKDEWVEALKSSIAEFQNKKAKYTTKAEERLERSFYIKVADVKFKENPEEKRDVYCTIHCDGAQLARTPTIYQTEKPVFLEEYDFDISPAAQNVSVILRSQKKDVNIGQALIPLMELDHHVHDSWYKLSFVPNRIEGAKLSTRWNLNEADKKFTIFFLSTQGLKGEIHVTVKCGSFESTSKPSSMLGDLGKSKKGEKHPSWTDESATFTFGSEGIPEQEVVLEIWFTPSAVALNEGKKGEKDKTAQEKSNEVKEKEFIGGVTISYDQIQEYNMKDCWWDIVETTARADNKIVGEIKLSLQLKESVILPDKAYEGLFKLLVENDMDFAKKFASVSQQQERQVAEALVKSFEMRLVSIPFIRSITQKEIGDTTRAEIIFRSNTVASKSFDLYMKLTGGPYLHYCLKDIVNQIFTASNSGKKSCELDSQRFDPAIAQDEKKVQKIREKNVTVLLGYCDQIFVRIKNSFLYCPANFRKLFCHIQKCVKEKFPDNELIQYTAPGGFIWLRFFCPSLTAPKQFGLLEDNLPPLASRDLTLVAKVLQNLANLVLFGKKEPYMEVCNEWLQVKQPEMREFLNTLCSLPTEAIDEIPSKRDVLNWGREMARVHFHMAEAMGRLLEKYGPFEIEAASEIIDKLNEEVELATGHTMKFKSKAPKLIESESPRSPSSPIDLQTTDYKLREKKEKKEKEKEKLIDHSPSVKDDRLFDILYLGDTPEDILEKNKAAEDLLLRKTKSAKKSKGASIVDAFKTNSRQQQSLSTNHTTHSTPLVDNDPVTLNFAVPNPNANNNKDLVVDLGEELEIDKETKDKNEREPKDKKEKEKREHNSNSRREREKEQRKEEKKDEEKKEEEKKEEDNKEEEKKEEESYCNTCRSSTECTC